MLPQDAVSERNPNLPPSEVRALQALSTLKLMTYDHYSLASGIAYTTAAGNIPPLVCRELVQVSQVYNTQNAGFGKILTPEYVFALTTKGVRFCKRNGMIRDGEASFVPTNWSTGRKLYEKDDGVPAGCQTLTNKDIFHTLGIAQVQAAIIRSLANDPSRELVEMLPDYLRIGRGKKRKKLTADYLPSGRRIEADSITVLENVLTGAQTSLFVEYQHRNRSRAVFSSKLESFREYFDFDNRKHNKGVPLLLFVTSTKSLVEVMTTSEKCWNGLESFRQEVRFAWEEDIKTDFLRAPWVDGFGKHFPITSPKEAVH